MGRVHVERCELYLQEIGEGAPILLIHPSGATASTWGSVIDPLAGIGRVISYDRRGYARSGGGPAGLARHTADAAAILEYLGTPPALVVGTSAGAAIAVSLAVGRPDLVKAVVSHEFPWRMNHHVPTASQLAVFARMGSFVLRRRHADAAEALLRAAYCYRDSGSAWDAFPEEWRQAGRENAKATLRDFVGSIGNHPSARDLATIKVPVVCSHGSRSPEFMVRLTRSLAAAIPTARTEVTEGAAHAAPFDAPANFARLIADAMETIAPVGYERGRRRG
jgi:pimeloyl-ACP methyl ester carboxylesterase